NLLLINYYGKPYNAATAGTDPGIPEITSSDVTAKKFERATVQEIYDLIISDLTTAIPDLPVRITDRLRMSKAAAEGILAKSYLYMGKFSESLTMLNKCFEDLAGATLPVGLYDYNVALNPGGSFFPIGPFGPTYPTAPNQEENIFA